MEVKISDTESIEILEDYNGSEQEGSGKDLYCEEGDESSSEEGREGDEGSEAGSEEGQEGRKVTSSLQSETTELDLDKELSEDPLIGQTYSRLGGLSIKPTSKRRKLPIKKLTENHIDKAVAETAPKEDTSATLSSSILDDNIKITYDATIDWGDYNVKDIVEKMFIFSKSLSGVPLHPYQEEFQKRIFESVLVNDGEEITALISRQSGKCFGYGTKVLMYDGSIKEVQNIQKGDVLMGDDSTPRVVTSTTSGIDRLYKVSPVSKRAESFVCNEPHTLCLKRRFPDGKKYVEMTVLEATERAAELKNSHLQAYQARLTFKAKPVSVEPYFMGLWLGDGSSRDQRVITTDAEVIEYLSDYAKRLGLSLSVYGTGHRTKEYCIVRSEGSTATNPIMAYLRDTGLLGNKHVHDDYRLNSEEVRLEVLAGIIDSDGHRSVAKGKESTCEITLKNKSLVDGVVFLARSLGFRTCIKKVTKGIKSTGFVGEYYRISVYGDLWRIPTRIPRKQYQKRELKDDTDTYGITIDFVGEGEYYGFTLSGNKRFLLHDLTVVHNTECVAQTCNTLLVLMPKLADFFPQQLGHYKKGFRIGIFAPTSEQARTLHARMDERLSGESAADLLADPDIQADKRYTGGVLAITGARYLHHSGKMVPSFVSFCRLQSASVQSKIESKTYDLIIVDEAQEVSTVKVQKSIRPMLASTNGTMVQIGTCTYQVSDFYHAIQRNKRKEMRYRNIRNHFEYDYRICQRYNPKYKAYVQKEKERLGEESDAFQLSYALKWMIEKGMAVTASMFDEYLKYSSGKFEYAANPGEHYVGGLDLAKESDSTVLTVAKMIPVQEVSDEGSMEEKYLKIVVNWLEMTGDNWEIQFGRIMEFIQAFRLEVLTVDSTGVGDPIFDRLEAALDEAGSTCTLVPVVYTLKSKHEMAVTFYDEMRKQRIKIPYHQSVTKTRRFRNFQDQLFSCVKTYKKSYMQIEHPNEKDAHDDYVNSLLLLIHGAEKRFQSSIRSYDTVDEMFDDENGGINRFQHSQRFRDAMERATAGRSRATWRRKSKV